MKKKSFKVLEKSSKKKEKSLIVEPIRSYKSQKSYFYECDSIIANLHKERMPFDSLYASTQDYYVNFMNKLGLKIMVYENNQEEATEEYYGEHLILKGPLYLGEDWEVAWIKQSVHTHNAMISLRYEKVMKNHQEFINKSSCEIDNLEKRLFEFDNETGNDWEHLIETYKNLITNTTMHIEASKRTINESIDKNNEMSLKMSELRLVYNDWEKYHGK